MFGEDFKRAVSFWGEFLKISQIVYLKARVAAAKEREDELLS